MKTIPYFLILSLIVLGTSCETLVNTLPESKLPQVDTKLVVQSFISPQDSLIKVVVTESSPLFGETTPGNRVISKALVSLSNGTTTAVIPYDTASQLYALPRARFPIAAGRTYTLTVTDGTRTATAACTVPAQQVFVASYKIDSAVASSQVFGAGFIQRDTVLLVKALWQDPAGQPNFYRLKGWLQTESSVIEFQDRDNYTERRVVITRAFDWDESNGRPEFQSDLNLDGIQLSSPIGRVVMPQTTTTNYQGKLIVPKQKTKILAVTLRLLNTDQHYYEYHRSVELSRRSGNPFAEPALVYSNVTGGLGVFAGFTSTTVVARP
ncbi:hypothetical protein GCM10027275_37810 [Rhabdobacter roseus]|uniref:DUF4249 domain-containing protein n=1 Tax=Rhabdobacter roseus TaxID=1655419 RepID=A0A840U100_9BACT|nr:DUF4249 domain-containing protein [Rhabdobacter roseus]MBB5285810.1 hypothetical protein [Rhabdobacter roseus]